MSLIKDLPIQKPDRLSTQDDTIQRLDEKTRFIFSHKKHKDCKCVPIGRSKEKGKKQCSIVILVIGSPVFIQENVLKSFIL